MRREATMGRSRHQKQLGRDRRESAGEGREDSRCVVAAEAACTSEIRARRAAIVVRAIARRMGHEGDRRDRACSEDEAARHRDDPTVHSRRLARSFSCTKRPASVAERQQNGVEAYGTRGVPVPARRPRDRGPLLGDCARACALRKHRRATACPGPPLRGAIHVACVLRTGAERLEPPEVFDEAYDTQCLGTRALLCPFLGGLQYGSGDGDRRRHWCRPHGRWCSRHGPARRRYRYPTRRHRRALRVSDARLRPRRMHRPVFGPEQLRRMRRCLQRHAELHERRMCVRGGPGHVRRRLR